MFTGIIEALGTVKAFERKDGTAKTGAARLTIHAGRYGRKLRRSDSVLVDGVCLTVVARRAMCLSFDLARETVRRTNFGRLAPGSRVNLEDSLRQGEPFGGHLVYGHVDGALKVLGWDGELIWLERPARWAPYIVEKGAVALNGISLTVALTRSRKFAVAIIPYTRSHTNLTDFAPGDRINFEIDPVARYRGIPRRRPARRR